MHGRPPAGNESLASSPCVECYSIVHFRASLAALARVANCDQPHNGTNAPESCFQLFERHANLIVSSSGCVLC